MTAKNTLYLSLMLLIASFAMAQIPCNPSVLPKATLFVDWPQFRYDSQHTGCNPYESILSTASVGGLVLDWSYPTGSPVFGDPVVANGMVYFTSNKYPDSGLFALNSRTGALVWASTAGQTIRTAPAVANGLVYIGQGAGLYAFNAATGDLAWQYLSPNGVSGPTVVDGVVYAGGGLGLVALNASTGNVLWSYPIDGGVQTPAVANGVLYFNSIKEINPNSYVNALYAFNIATQQIIWQLSWNDAAATINPPIVGNGAVYFNSTAYKANTGAVLWNAPAYFYSLPALADGKVYYGSFGGIYAVSASTGNVVWSVGTGTSGDGATPAVANGVVYIAAQNGHFYALNAATGAVLWQYPFSNAGGSGPAVANGIVYIGSFDQNLYAFHLPD